MASDYVELLSKTDVPCPMIPFWRRLLGDEAVVMVGNRFGEGYTEDEDEVARILDEEERELFPEARNFKLQLWKKAGLEEGWMDKLRHPS